MATVLDEKEVRRRVSRNVRSFRVARGLSMAALARTIGDYPGSIKRIEDGVSTPGSVILSRLAEALEVSIDTLMSPPEKNFSKAS